MSIQSQFDKISSLIVGFIGHSLHNLRGLCQVRGLDHYYSSVKVFQFSLLVDKNNMECIFIKTSKHKQNNRE